MFLGVRRLSSIFSRFWLIAKSSQLIAFQKEMAGPHWPETAFKYANGETRRRTCGSVTSNRRAFRCYPMGDDAGAATYLVAALLRRRALRQLRLAVISRASLAQCGKQFSNYFWPGPA